MSIARKEAIHRRRRIILNDDAYELQDPNAHSEAGFLDACFGHILDTQIDSIWWSFIMNSDRLGYNTKVGDVAGKIPVPGSPKKDLESWATVWNNISSFIERGTDPLKFICDWGHGVGREVFASFRMNMVQDSWRPNFNTQWKRDHPEYCLGERGMLTNSDNPDEQLCWSALDWEHQAVRDQRFALIDEICSGYDVDGMELDFWRWPVFFKPTMYHEPVEQKHIDMMTDFMRKTRNRMMEIDAERDRPLILAPRVFDTLEINRRMGLDVETWLEEGLLDILVVGGSYNHFSFPVSDWVELAHKHDVPLYACLYGRNGLEHDLAVASHYWSCGADGIYTFNLRFPRDLEFIHELGDAETISHKPKRYVMNHSNTGTCLQNGAAPGLLPVRLEEGRPTTARLLVGDDTTQAADEDSLSELNLRLSLTNFDPSQDELAVTLNGHHLKNPLTVQSEDPFAHRRGREWQGIEGSICSLQFKVFTLYADIRMEPTVTKGENRVGLTLGARASGLTEPVDLVGLELFIRYQ